jgi:FdhD protein
LDGNNITVELGEALQVDLKKLERHFYTSSSCGVCGKTSIEAVKTLTGKVNSGSGLQMESAVLTRLPDLLRRQQQVFESTGGLHASALFDAAGNLLLLREDVGRHNALDKLIGAAFEKQWTPLNEKILLLSGRASFELIQKAAMAGILSSPPSGPHPAWLSNWQKKVA